MRIGNQLGGVLVWVLAVAMSGPAGAQTAERVTTVPLGGTLGGQAGDRYFGVYVPTRFGGELRIKATSGEVAELRRAPDGPVIANGRDIGLDRQGWYTFKVKGAQVSVEGSGPVAVKGTPIQLN